MPLRKFRFIPQGDDNARALPRLAADHDASIVSPVHTMHENLSILTENPPEPAIALYPGWFRLTFPLAASGALWVGIFWVIGQLR